MAPTHEVTNQPPPLAGYDVFGADAALVDAVQREGAEWALDDLHDLGRLAGTTEAIEHGATANEQPPRLRTHDRYGNRIDEVVYHPSYHHLLRTAVAHGLHASPWRDPRDGAHVARAAGVLVWGQVEAGHTCPVSMTYAIVPALRAAPELADEWEPRLTALSYNAALLPAADKPGALAGMGMTEKQGGSDVRTNTTRAEPLTDGGWALTGHKWFCSAPMSDVFLMLAQAPDGLSCFLVPRILPDGTRNTLRIQRLKDKLGNRSNASSEVELDGTWSQLVGEPGRGVATIIEMVNLTRLDCVLGSAGGMRQAVAQATHHAAYRTAFGAYLDDQPLMQNVLADLVVESEAATVLAMRLARAVDRAPHDEAEAHFRRLATAVAKFWVCKRAAPHAAEALECLGGNGYVEESGMPRLYREAPLNSIWEGSGNVNALDVLRAMVRTPAAVEAYFTEVAAAQGGDPRLDAAMIRLLQDLRESAGLEGRARRLVEQLALVLQGALLVRYGDAAVADAFCASRLGGDWGRTFGTLPAGVDTRAIMQRSTPKID